MFRRSQTGTQDRPGFFVHIDFQSNGFAVEAAGGVAAVTAAIDMTMAITATALHTVKIRLLTCSPSVSDGIFSERHRDPDPPVLNYLKTEVTGWDRCAIPGDGPCPDQDRQVII
jgi:hypothetical protein